MWSNVIRVSAALPKTVQISNEQARSQKLTRRFDLASFTSMIARSGSAESSTRKRLRMLGSGNTYPTAMPKDTRKTAQAVFRRLERDESRKSHRLLAQRTGPKPRKMGTRQHQGVSFLNPTKRGLATY